MKLKDMKRLPEKAGKARLHFIKFGPGKTPHEPPHEFQEFPKRDDKEILLAEDPNIEFFRLSHGQQFLLQIPAYLPTSASRTWFGGTDENPFLVPLVNHAFNIFEQEGEEAFYEALKPEVITAVERRFNVVSQRQGDIWAAPVPYSWEKMKFIRFLCFGEAPEPREVLAEHLFGTRHVLTGLITRPRFAPIDLDTHYVWPNFGEGTIEAPDHTPLKLEGVHVLTQTKLLHNPEKAD